MADGGVDDTYTGINGWDNFLSIGRFDLITGVQSAGPSHAKVHNLHTYNAGSGRHSWGGAPLGVYYQGCGVNILTGTDFVVSNCTDYGSYGGFWADTNGGARGSFSNCTAIDTAQGPIWSDAAAGSNTMWYTDGVFGGTITGSGSGWKKTPGGVAFMIGTYGVSLANCTAFNPANIGLALDQNSSGCVVTNFRVVNSRCAGIVDAGIDNMFVQPVFENCCRSTGSPAEPSGSVCPEFACFEAVGQADGFVSPVLINPVVRGSQAYPVDTSTRVYKRAFWARRSASGHVSRINVIGGRVRAGVDGVAKYDVGCEVAVATYAGGLTEMRSYGASSALSMAREDSDAIQILMAANGDAALVNYNSGRSMTLTSGGKSVSIDSKSVKFTGLPTSATGLDAGHVWVDAGSGNVIKQA
jgi:hypothetical protein